MIRLTEAQRTAINEINQNLQIVACAGSGKTEVITRRIARLLREKTVLPKNIVAFTFTEKAAESMKSRIASALATEQYDTPDLHEMFVGTIHGFCWNLLQTYSTEYSDYKILDTVKSHLFIERYSSMCGLSDLGLAPSYHNRILFLDCISKMIDNYDAKNEWTETQTAVFEKYMDCLKRHHYIDFSTLIFEAIRTIKESKTVQDYIRSVKYLIVDEYQDIDDLQESLIRSFSSFGANICVVGDDDQTIYQFRGSNADNMIEFANRYPNVRQIMLDTNFRCASQIVSVAESVIQHNNVRIKKEMKSANIKMTGNVEAIRCEDADEQYAHICQKIIELRKSGVPYKEIAVLSRKGKYIDSIKRILEQHSIPCVANSSESFFHGSYFFRLKGTLAFLASPEKATLYECWEDVVSRSQLLGGYKALRRTAISGGTAKSLRLSESIASFLKQIDFLSDKYADIDEREWTLSFFETILNDYDEIYGDLQLSARVTKLLRFLEYASEEYKYYAIIQGDNPDDAVQIMTVHKSKGLEFHAVFLPNLSEGQFPVSRIGGKKYYSVLGGYFASNKDKYESDVEDERKLFYVAATRAKQQLFFLFDNSRKGVSRFVREASKSGIFEIDPDELEEEQFKRNADIALEALRDYYGTAVGFMPGAFGDLEALDYRDADDLIGEARSLGFL